jgi:hypothetical protein
MYETISSNSSPQGLGKPPAPEVAPISLHAALAEHDRGRTGR